MSAYSTWANYFFNFSISNSSLYIKKKKGFFLLFFNPIFFSLFMLFNFTNQIHHSKYLLLLQSHAVPQIPPFSSAFFAAKCLLRLCNQQPVGFLQVHFSLFFLLKRVKRTFFFESSMNITLSRQQNITALCLIDSK